MIAHATNGSLSKLDDSYIDHLKKRLTDTDYRPLDRPLEPDRPSFGVAGTSSRATESRVSIAFELQRADVPAFDEPLLDPFDIPPFEERLKLIARQLLQYQHTYILEPELAHFASALLAK